MFNAYKLKRHLRLCCSQTVKNTIGSSFYFSIFNAQLNILGCLKIRTFDASAFCLARKLKFSRMNKAAFNSDIMRRHQNRQRRWYTSYSNRRKVMIINLSGRARVRRLWSSVEGRGELRRKKERRMRKKDDKARAHVAMSKAS
jgi:hypothetical protein